MFRFVSQTRHSARLSSEFSMSCGNDKSGGAVVASRRKPRGSLVRRCRRHDEIERRAAIGDAESAESASSSREVCTNDTFTSYPRNKRNCRRITTKVGSAIVFAALRARVSMRRRPMSWKYSARIGWMLLHRVRKDFLIVDTRIVLASSNKDGRIFPTSRCWRCWPFDHRMQPSE